MDGEAAHDVVDAATVRKTGCDGPPNVVLGSRLIRILARLPRMSRLGYEANILPMRRTNWTT